MPIFVNHKLIFIHIPKTGGQSITNYFTHEKNNLTLLNCGNNDDKITNNINDDNHSIHYTLKEIKTWNIKKKINIDEYIKFTIVRNPYNRFLSALFFADLLNEKSTSIDVEILVNSILCNSEIFKNIKSINKCNCKNVNFIEFLPNKFIELKHVLPQYTFLTNNNNNDIDYNIIILKFENLKDEIKKINIYDFNIHINKNIKNNKYENLLNQHIKNKIYDFYKKDFELFGYI
jgi:hypothetical protein